MVVGEAEAIPKANGEKEKSCKEETIVGSK